MKNIAMSILAVVAFAQASPVAKPSETPRPITPAPIIPPPLGDIRGLDMQDPGLPKDKIPSCAILCINSYADKRGKCELADHHCICADLDFQDPDIMRCTIDGCGYTKSQNRVVPAVENFCAERLKN
ncbi:Extracellular membrane protein, CFEM domain protein [Cordyceps fumosorosea ARSEF 2679]|uniref:Extracellular membrane protein, CFEM domain protein n=1 Tax=Cordyceps fumosorosea (strain ARSEF 2679) TaxID=1081104 RepID=A0A167LG97_CORFA|nr:Extracellular membrane protein, CFEM domain protein [Cordyceps fumosorosea ARSEF 2679]OAA53056.1 Extracellular membrane protein, CFEM domain protein [Cordyceps fumosorosea ARSEF 2679]